MINKCYQYNFFYTSQCHTQSVFGHTSTFNEVLGSAPSACSFRRFSTCVWQDAHLTSFRHAICIFLFLKFYNFIKACVCYFLLNFYFFTKWEPFKNYEKCLFHLECSFHSWDIQMFVIFSLPFHSFQIQKGKWK